MKNEHSAAVSYWPGLSNQKSCTARRVAVAAWIRGGQRMELELQASNYTLAMGLSRNKREDAGLASSNRVLASCL